MLLALLLACTPTPDDTADTADTGETADTSDTGSPPLDEAIAGIGLDFGDVEGVTVGVSLGAGVEAGSAELSMFVQALGSDLDVSFDPCFMPNFELRDQGGGVVWSGTDPYAGACKEGVETRVVAEGDTISSGFAIDGVADGVYTLGATQRMRAAGHDDPVASTGDFFDWPVLGRFRLGEGAAFETLASGDLPNGLAIGAEGGPSSAPATEARDFAVRATPEAELGGVWNDCGWGRFTVFDEAGSQVWTGSAADAADCMQVKGWPAGEERLGEYSMPGGTVAGGAALSVRSSYTARDGQGGERSYWALSGFSAD